jgi:hypothetical protein
MKERDIVKSIRSYMEKVYHATCHKYWGGAFSETGHSDLYGTLPGGYAYWFEVKVPGRVGRTTEPQKRFLKAEADHGAVAGVVTSLDDVDNLLKDILDNSTL